MSNPEIETSQAPGAEFSIPEGCVVCGGELDVRVTPGNAWSYCKQCHLLAKPEVKLDREGLRVGHAIELLA